MNMTEFDRWVGGNNVSADLEYKKAWWDYVELIRRLANKFDVREARVVGHYVVRTPPPEEQLPMPAVALETGGALVALKWDFGATSRWPREWTASVRRRSPYMGPIFGLFDPAFELIEEHAEGLAPEFVFPSYRESPAKFSCELEDEWDIATLLRFAFYEP